MSIAVKICGLTEAESVEAAVAAGADYLGFNFFPKSPRFVLPDQAAALVEAVPESVLCVGLFVDPDDAALIDVLGKVRLDYVQLHGVESPERVDAVRLEYGLPVMKVFGVSEAEDIQAAEAYENHADMALFDAKPPAGASRPGGNAEAFDWDLMQAYGGSLPWLLAGGLTPETVAEAIKRSGAPGVDVASGVESASGQKDPALIKAFVQAAKGVKAS